MEILLIIAAIALAATLYLIFLAIRFTSFQVERDREFRKVLKGLSVYPAVVHPDIAEAICKAMLKNPKSRAMIFDAMREEESQRKGKVNNG